jgi:hypothetical protein
MFHSKTPSAECFTIVESPDVCYRAKALLQGGWSVMVKAFG